MVRLSAWAGLTVLALVLSPIGQSARADGYVFRPYVQARAGAAFFPDTNSAFDVEVESPSGQPTYGASIGADISDHLGFEIAIDETKAILSSPSIGKVGDYGVAAVTALARLRYPLGDGRFVPYLLGGGGVALGEFSGPETFDIATGGEGYTPVAVLGAGAEYFVADNIAVGFGARHSFLIETPLRLGNAEQDIDLSHLTLAASLRIYFDRAAGLLDRPDRPQPPPRDSDAMRGYIFLRGGQAFFLDPKSVPGLELDRTSGILGTAGAGLNFDGHWSAELVGQYARAQLRDRAGNKVTGYPVYSIIAQGRYRQPIFDGRVSPYLLAGAGVGCGEMGDRDAPVEQTGFTGWQDCGPVGALGAGFDYFLEDNVALNLEAKYVAPLETDIRLNGRSRQLNLDHLSWSAGLRVFFP